MSTGHPVERGLDRDRLLSEISCEQVRLAKLDRARERAATRLEALRQQLAADLDAAVLGGPSAPAVSGRGTPTTSQEKVALFRALFRGRADVFPVRFESKKTGKAGYAPACANKFVRGLCELPRVKCGECPNQAFVAADDQAVLDHLRGRHVMGVYPLLPDNTCWFLAADFDKASWMEDTAASRPDRIARTSRRQANPSARKEHPYARARSLRERAREFDPWAAGLAEIEYTVTDRLAAAMSESIRSKTRASVSTLIAWPDWRSAPVRAAAIGMNWVEETMGRRQVVFTRGESPDRSTRRRIRQPIEQDRTRQHDGETEQPDDDPPRRYTTVL